MPADRYAITNDSTLITCDSTVLTADLISAAMAWPTAVPAYAEQGTFKEQPVPNINAFPVDSGPDLTSRKASIGIRKIQYSFKATTTQKVSLNSFFVSTLKDGVYRFNLDLSSISSDLNGTYKFDPKTPPNYSDAGYNCWRVDVQLFKVP